MENVKDYGASGHSLWTQGIHGESIMISSEGWNMCPAEHDLKLVHSKGRRNKGKNGKSAYGEGTCKPKISISEL